MLYLVQLGVNVGEQLFSLSLSPTTRTRSRAISLKLLLNLWGLQNQA